MMDHVDQLTIEIDDGSRTLEKDCEASVISATAQQRQQMGSAAQGMAWRIWSTPDSHHETIRFMPPAQADTARQKRLLESYRCALQVANHHEMTSLSLPLPEHAGLACDEHAPIEALVADIVQQGRSLNYLHRIHLLAGSDQEAQRAAESLKSAGALDNDRG